MMLIAIALFLLLTEVVSPGLGVALVALAVVFEAVEIWLWLRYLRRHRVRTGVEGMIGDRGRVVESCLPEGTVKLRGEIWAARSLTGARSGQTVRVTGVDGLTLEVEPEAGVRSHDPVGPTI